MGQVAHALAAPEADETIIVEGLEFTREQVESESFFDDHGETIIDRLSQNVYYTEYSPENRVRHLEECGEIAEAMFAVLPKGNARAAGIDAIERNRHHDHLFSEDCLPSCESFLQELKGAVEDEGWSWNHDDDEVAHSLAEGLVEKVTDEDDSTPEDIFSSCDMAEIAFYLIPPGVSYDDCCLSGQKSWPDWSEMVIDQHFIRALHQLGHTLEAYREHSGNQSDAIGTVDTKPAGLPLVSLDQMQQMVDNASANYFIFAIYAHVPISDLLKIDFSRPIKLDNHAVSVINPSSQTFFDILKKEPIVLRPTDGQWRAFKKGPADWCCMVGRPFHASISN